MLHCGGLPLRSQDTAGGGFWRLACGCRGSFSLCDAGAVPQVKKYFQEDLDPGRRYIFAYVPHSMYPAGAAYSPMLHSWTCNFPGITPVTLTASIMHYVPIMRDIGAWVGFREVRPTRDCTRRKARRSGLSACVILPVDRGPARTTPVLILTGSACVRVCNRVNSIVLRFEGSPCMERAGCS